MSPVFKETTTRAEACRPVEADVKLLTRAIDALAALAAGQNSEEFSHLMAPVLGLATDVMRAESGVLGIGRGLLEERHVHASAGPNTDALQHIANTLIAGGALAETSAIAMLAKGAPTTGATERARALLAGSGFEAAWVIGVQDASNRWDAVFAAGYGVEQAVGEPAVLAVQRLLQHAAEIVERGRSATELRAVNDSLRREVELAHKFFDAAAVGMYLTDADGRFLRVNRAYAEIVGYSTAELTGMHFTALVPPASHEATRQAQEARLAGDTSPREWTIVRKDGTERIVCVHGASALSIGGRQYVLGALNDITDERRMVEALRESEERFRALANSSPAPIWMTSAAGELQFINESYAKFFGCAVEEVRGAGWQPLLHPEDRAAYSDAFYAASQSRQPFRAQARVRNAAGEWRWIASHGLPRLSASGEFLGMVGISPDVTEVKLAQDELARTNETLEARVAERTERLREIINQLETFSYSMAHDIRAPLRSMRAFADLLLEDHAAELTSPAKDYLVRIAHSAARLDLLTRDVLSYSRLLRSELKLGRINLESLLRGILESYPNLHPSRGDVTIESPLPDVRGNAAALTQVLANMLDNALKFVAPGVRPRVRIRGERRSASGSGAPGASVRIWIDDNGIGIEPDIQQRVVFGMFERLHPREYDGTGMGLTIACKAIERMGGSIGLESTPGRGSSFWFELPEA